MHGVVGRRWWSGGADYGGRDFGGKNFGKSFRNVKMIWGEGVFDFESMARFSKITFIKFFFFKKNSVADVV